MADTGFALNFSGIPPTVLELHVHLEYAQEIATAITAMEAKVSALSDAVTQVQTDVSALLASNDELVKDVQRLIADGNTTQAVSLLGEVSTNLQNAKAAIDSLDTSVETADPEPPTTAEATATEPNSEGSVTDLLS